jgi:5-methylcytosine-specific restriction endonuclease McrA
MLANKSMPCENLSKKARKTLVLAEQGGVCLWCGLNSWRDEPLVLELDHIDGNKKNNIRKNLRILCPNCHSQTPTWKNRKQKEKQEVGAGDGS